MTRYGLRRKFNVTLLPVVAGTVLMLGWLDARHERDAVMAAHALHAQEVSAGAAIAAVEGATNPDDVARRSLVMHGIYAVALVILIGSGVNAALSRFVLTPIGRIRDGIEKMQRGHWRMPQQPATQDEVGRVVESFQLLGLTVDAIVQQLLRTERLATLALVAKKTTTLIEPRVQRIVAAAGDLQRLPDERAHDVARAVTAASAEILAALSGLDQLFEANMQLASSRPDRTKRTDHQLGEAAATEPPGECRAEAG